MHEPSMLNFCLNSPLLITPQQSEQNENNKHGTKHPLSGLSLALLSPNVQHGKKHVLTQLPTSSTQPNKLALNGPNSHEPCFYPVTTTTYGIAPPIIMTGCYC